MNSSVSVVETVVRELNAKGNASQYLLHTDGLPYDFGRLLTPSGFNYVQSPENLERYWHMHKRTFEPVKWEGKWEQDPQRMTTTFNLQLEAPSVTVISARRIA